MSKFLLVPAAFALALTLAACGGDAPANSTPPAADTTTTTTTPAPTTPAPTTPAPATTPAPDAGTMAPAAPATP
ncbi:hypothetical protein [uncultured Devosia sp.]|uniref:hypothetical protein n=1 Tax=uncultured Devosia sp. TaxID=211434 RepID=UPI0035CB039C